MSISRARGVSLVELVVFIVIVGVAMAGLFAAFNTMTARSADPQVRKQVLAIAESLMEEIQLMPFTYCDPDDPAAPTATGTGDCATVEGIGQEAPETATSRDLFDNVSDYHNFSMSPIKNIDGVTVTGLENYSASVTVANAGTALGLGADDRGLRITVTATHLPTGTQIVLEGFRARYAPTVLP